MKDEQLYRELKKLAEQLDVVVAEHNFKNTGIRVKSGSCLVKDQKHCIIDKHVRIQKKIAVLSECLGAVSLENVFVIPAIREHIERFAKKNEAGAAPPFEGEKAHQGNRHHNLG